MKSVEEFLASFKGWSDEDAEEIRRSITDSPWRAPEGWKLTAPPPRTGSHRYKSRRPR